MLDVLYRRLSAIRTFEFIAKSGPSSKMHWNGQAKGEVVVKTDASSITFTDTGLFIADSTGKSLKQRNVYRWEFLEDGVNVYQERRDIPVFLVKLIWRENSWKSLKAHQCGDDFYSLKLSVNKVAVSAIWTIQGPKKDERLEYHYQF